MFGAVKPGFRSLATLKLVMNVVGELPKRIAAASRGFLAIARLSCTALSHYRVRCDLPPQQIDDKHSDDVAYCKSYGVFSVMMMMMMMIIIIIIIIIMIKDNNTYLCYHRYYA